MKFVPFKLFRFLYVPPVDIEKYVKTHFEARIEELTQENSEYHAQIIQLGNQIVQLSGELEATQQELELSKKGAKFWEANYEMKVEVLEAHRDAFRVVFNTFTKIGAVGVECRACGATVAGLGL